VPRVHLRFQKNIGTMWRIAPASADVLHSAFYNQHLAMEDNNG
jgi:hypothetical protein